MKKLFAKRLAPPSPPPPPWSAYCIPGSFNPKTSDQSVCVMTTLRHVTHVSDARRLVEDQTIWADLVRDKSVLNTTRICVVWTSPNTFPASLYGNISFELPIGEVMKGRNVYWVEVMTNYKPTAIRLLVSSRQHTAPLVAFDPQLLGGPIYCAPTGDWFRLNEYNYEIMLDEDLSLKHCNQIGFKRHHGRLCNKFGTNVCPEKSRAWDNAARAFVAFVLAKEPDLVPALLVGRGAELNLELVHALEQVHRLIESASKKARSVLAVEAVPDVLQAALLALGDDREKLARQCARALGDAEAATHAFVERVANVFGETVSTALRERIDEEREY